jgi:hypothetical protein
MFRWSLRVAWERGQGRGLGFPEFRKVLTQCDDNDDDEAAMDFFEHGPT